jgi:hypothetical protein
MKKPIVFSLNGRTIEFAPGAKYVELRISGQEPFITPIPNPSDHPNGMMDPQGDDLPTIEWCWYEVGLIKAIEFSTAEIIFLVCSAENSVEKADLPADLEKFEWKDLMKFMGGNRTYLKITLRENEEKDGYKVLIETFKESPGKVIYEIQKRCEKWVFAMTDSYCEKTVGRMGAVELTIAGLTFANYFPDAWSNPDWPSYECDGFLAHLPK